MHTYIHIHTHYTHLQIAPGDEDPYQADEFIHSDQFVPHHTAQRDIYNDHQKKDNFASTLRNNVANIQYYAEQALLSEVVVDNNVNSVHVHNVNNVDSGVIGNKNKPRHRSSNTTSTTNNTANTTNNTTTNTNTTTTSPTSPAKGKVSSPTNHRRSIIYNTIDGNSMVANIQDSVALNSGHSSPTAAGRRMHSTHTTPDHTSIQNHTPYTTHATHTTHDTSPPHSARRKALLYRDNIPINNTDININNTTHDKGIGSRGPVMKHSVNNITKSTATLSKWMNMLTSGTVHNLYTTTNPTLYTTYDWDEDEVPYTKNTKSTDYRIKANKLRPHSANAVNTKRSNSSNNTDSTVYGIMQYPNPNTANNNFNHTTNTISSTNSNMYDTHNTDHALEYTVYDELHHTTHSRAPFTTPNTTHHNVHSTPHSTHTTPYTTRRTNNIPYDVEEGSVHVKFAAEDDSPQQAR